MHDSKDQEKLVEGEEKLSCLVTLVLSASDLVLDVLEEGWEYVEDGPAEIT